MREDVVIALLVFTACLFAAYGAWVVRHTDRNAEKRGDERGYARGKSVGNLQEWLRGRYTGDREGHERGKKEGYELGFNDAQPVRGERGRFKRRGQ